MGPVGNHRAVARGLLTRIAGWSASRRFRAVRHWPVADSVFQVAPACGRAATSARSLGFPPGAGGTSAGRSVRHWACTPPATPAAPAAAEDPTFRPGAGGVEDKGLALWARWYVGGPGSDSRLGPGGTSSSGSVARSAIPRCLHTREMAIARPTPEAPIFRFAEEGRLEVAGGPRPKATLVPGCARHSSCPLLPGPCFFRLRPSGHRPPALCSAGRSTGLDGRGEGKSAGADCAYGLNGLCARWGEHLARAGLGRLRANCGPPVAAVRGSLSGPSEGRPGARKNPIAGALRATPPLGRESVAPFRRVLP